MVGRDDTAEPVGNVIMSFQNTSSVSRASRRASGHGFVSIGHRRWFGCRAVRTGGSPVIWLRVSLEALLTFELATKHLKAPESLGFPSHGRFEVFVSLLNR
jgi:hypothetical protein